MSERIWIIPLPQNYIPGANDGAKANTSTFKWITSLCPYSTSWWDGNVCIINISPPCIIFYSSCTVKYHFKVNDKVAVNQAREPICAMILFTKFCNLPQCSYVKKRGTIVLLRNTILKKTYCVYSKELFEVAFSINTY